MNRAFSVHPFPARMAPELALRSLEHISEGTVLDPMLGSGTVVSLAKHRGLNAVGFDLDPLAVLISRVATTPVEECQIDPWECAFIDLARGLGAGELDLPWIDNDAEAARFVSFWFGERQIVDLRRIAFMISKGHEIGMSPEVVDIFRVALSRIIVTKKQAASLAQDTSHSRPHRVVRESNYDVFEGFVKSVRAVRRKVASIPTQGSARVSLCDARNMSEVSDSTIDVVLTSPPYLNAIDYMRGHRLSLIWLGYRYRDLARIRSNSIGSERRPDSSLGIEFFRPIKVSMGSLDSLSNRFHGMIDRYVLDLHAMISEVARVLKTNGQATFVMGDSCLNGVYIQNSEALVAAGSMVGLQLLEKVERELPVGSRYLPIPSSGMLSKRMRKEVILNFRKPT